MKTAHLFAGAGGGLLADLILGHEPILAVESDPACCEWLRARVSDGWFPHLHVWEGDIRLWNPSEWAGRVDCLHAGFPCQDISSAGKRLGLTGPKSSLVWEVFRAIDAIRPPLVFLENVAAIVHRGRREIIAELVARGYSWRDGILSAADVGAWHERARWWCLASNTVKQRCRPCRPARETYGRQPETDGFCDEIAAPVRPRRKNSKRLTTSETHSNLGRSDDVVLGQAPESVGATWFEIEPGVERLVHGVADGLVSAAIRALGNSQVPLQAALAFKILSAGKA